MFELVPRLRSVTRVVGIATALAAAAVVLAPAAGAQEEVDSYVALGDSFSSGNGTFRADLDIACYRSSLAYPALVAAERPNTELDFRACQGARTSDVVDDQVRALDADTDYVSITIGGNDIGFGDLIGACAGFRSTGCAAAVDAATARIRDELPAKLDLTYAAIRQAAPNARRVAVLGYGRFFGPRLACGPALGFSRSEATALNGVAERLDAVVADRAAAAGFDHRSALEAFTGHDVCARDPYLNGQNLSPFDAFHPTRRGHSQAYAPLVRSVIG